jgi:hypothetical protein
MSHFGTADLRATAWLRAPFATIAIVAIALIAASCAQQTDQHEAAAPAASKTRSATCQAEKSRLASLPEPDCEFRAVRQGTVDADEFARLKLAYERQCYQRAERAARQQLQELRASRACESKPSPLASR